MARPDDAVKCWCNRCRSDTYHHIAASHETVVSGTDPRGRDASRRLIYYVVECLGCKDIHFLKIDISPEDLIWCSNSEHPFDSPYVQENYPPRNIARRVPEWIDLIDVSLASMLRESYMALSIGAVRLAAMGGRAALEYIAIEKCEDMGSFKKNVNELVNAGFLAKNLESTILSALDVGSAAIHRGYTPGLESINDVFSIVENIVESVYLLPESGERLSFTTPKRPEKRKS
ncbi:DUF4145 domain-containing protein [Thalassobaculum litoreum]|uniref:DUF4145 domain-containing protein n=1 Tax=Thalassobaculum litoreum DSM 18839 TaxID=1123362 RepID=A0A8G2BKD8_9PROT|nr:DUF4145 domain-containing protein [Thalassobaculum litoreum]SDG21288.1 protein of unknown function [Thalassobaculum litoreum DSM 18839]